MCGIAGFVGPWSEALLRAMNDAQRHRGPDGEGTMFDSIAGVGLAHRRLAIIDLSDEAAQPMDGASGRYVIVFNGEIYNYRTLRATLEQEGVVFRTRSDTEVLLEAYARWGQECLSHLNGIFAFAVWDRERRSLFVARDHLGVKPLYYAALPQGFLFASELKTLAFCSDVPRDIDPVAVADHLGFVWSAGEQTMLKAVRKLRPGHCMTVDLGGVHVARWWRPPLPTTRERGDPAALTALIDKVVHDQMVADVPVGALLSGGVDSSAIVAAMTRATDPSRITTFCAAVEKGGGADNFGDDIRHAREVARVLGVRLVEVPTKASLIDGLKDMVWRLDEPTADFAALQTMQLAQAARANGITVLLSGVGGDDLFTGYGRHTAGLIYAMMNGARPIASLLSRLPPSGLVSRRLRRIGQLLALPENEMLVEAMSFSEVGSKRRAALLASAPHVPDALTRSIAVTGRLHPVERMIDLELSAFLPDHNLNYTDKMAMQAGVEVRVPLVDPRLVEFAARLPLNDRITLGTTKRILRRSQKGRLPESVLHRPKQGFGVPMRAWLAGPARPLMEELTGKSVVAARGLFNPAATSALRAEFLAGRIDAAFTLFPMMAIELWCRALGEFRPADLRDSVYLRRGVDG